MSARVCLRLARAALLLALLPLAAATGCRPGGDGAAGATPRVLWELSPRPARKGPVTIDFTLADATGAPVPATDVEVEANMSHPGMVPEIVAASASAPGTYRAELELTMGGDWYLLFRGSLPDGRAFELREDLPGVASR